MRRMRVGPLVAVALLAAGLTAPAGAAAKPGARIVAEAVPSGFVQAVGTSLTLAGSPFRINGASIYGTSNPGGSASSSQVLTWAAAAHLNTIRLVDVFDERGLDDLAPYDATNWAHVDQLLADISASGMHAVLDLSAFRNHLVNRDIRLHAWQSNCLPNADRTPVDYTLIDPYRVGLASEWQAFVDFVTARVNTVTGTRYRDDPTIAVISLAGEPQPPASQECGKATDKASLTEFYRRTLEMVRLDDANHLRSSGGLIHTDWVQLYGGDSGIDGKAIFALADNTLPAVHTYPPRYAADGTPIDYQTPVLGPWATSLGKPWFTEEFGWTQSVGDATRGNHYRWLYNEQQTYGSAGAMFWNLGPEVAGGSHDANPSTPATWSVIAARTLANESALGLGTFQVGPGSVCNPDGSGTINFTASGSATGPFPGSLTQTGTVTLGPTPPPQGAIVYYSPVTAFSATFTIVTGSTTITGTETLGTPEDTLRFGFFDLVNVGQCQRGAFTTNQYGIGVRYSATITAPDGVFTDAGFGHAFGAQSRSVSPSNLFEEEFASLLRATVPDPPTAVVAVADHGSATVTWLAPASNGGDPVRNYTVTANPGGQTANACLVYVVGGVERIALSSDVTCHYSNATVTGLTNGIAYTFTVTATNAVGTSSASAASSAVTPPPETVPDAPTSVTAAAGDATASVSWAAPASDGGSSILGYTVHGSSVAGNTTTSVAGDVTSTMVGGLGNGTPYTFTVTATNGVGTGPASGPSGAVTPQAGVPPPQTIAVTVPDSGGGATTDPGSGPTPSDPVTTGVIVPAGAGGGSLTIAETSITETPPAGGYQFVGQQVNITSSATTSASNPLTIIFAIDGSLLLAATGMVAPPPDSVDVTRAESGGPAVIPACTIITPSLEHDPCVFDRQYVAGDLQIIILSGSASHWNAAVKPVPVTVAAGGYKPIVVSVSQGGIVRWTFTGPKSHSATDTLKLGPAKGPLFDSGPKTSGLYGSVFQAAGTYLYGSTVRGDPGSFAGVVVVPVRISPTSGGTTTSFTVTWSSSTLSGYVFDVQYRFMKTGSKNWSPLKAWKSRTTVTSGMFIPLSGGGAYAFSSRLRNASTGNVSLWSPETTITVH